MNHLRAIAIAALAMATAPVSTWAQTADAMRGERVFRTCAACHSLERDRNMTGPSLTELWNRKAGGLASFMRYSPALKASGVVWNDRTLDDWINDPQHL